MPTHTHEHMHARTQRNTHKHTHTLPTSSPRVPVPIYYMTCNIGQLVRNTHTLCTNYITIQLIFLQIVTTLVQPQVDCAVQEHFAFAGNLDSIVDLAKGDSFCRRLAHLHQMITADVNVMDLVKKLITVNYHIQGGPKILLRFFVHSFTQASSASAVYQLLLYLDGQSFFGSPCIMSKKIVKFIAVRFFCEMKTRQIFTANLIKFFRLSHFDTIFTNFEISLILILSTNILILDDKSQRNKVNYII